MPNYRRASIPGGCWFFTVNLLDRRQTLLVDHIAALREAIIATRRDYPFVIDAFVVLPDHLHAMPPGDSDFSTRWRLIKSRFVKTLPRRETLDSVRIARNERGIWQRRFWEHLIRDEADYARHVEYCYINPLKHRYVARVSDWPHSSFHRDVRGGLFPHDWGGDVTTIGDFGERSAVREDP
ncbi:REP-associated tyrosine transposase [Bradyrhizobium ivorense]|uniref:REP-associated tyrosine transposase n=1 Tax=Bradyrhizobium ivorense TaxID=2511166 RepID=UPI0010B316E6|nr:transposase [Bradyrhizobium ivorense]VIO70981.1 REP-associated tyrosine transposase [Bradyrhizobium ivorense]